ncbi:hypothetical protein BCS42_16400 [Crenothrix sp. D3]|nr:hypothetical protein BCS42_16400 [Crenothrix sp. D3]
MNHIYRSVWNKALGAWVAVSEISKGQGKRSVNRRKLLATGLLICATPTWALPTGEQVVAGQATVNTPSAGQMQINQASQKAVINWQGFSINPNEAVNIQQPNAQAALLNRVVGQDASQIQGQLNANGQVYLVNPNGVVFSKTAQVDVGGLIATTHEISNQDFINGNNHFTQNGATGSVENHGTINTKDGGVVALIGEKVTNTGTINTPKGTTALAAGKTVDLDFQGDGLVEVKVTEAALNAQITNQGAIQADGGRVVMSAKAANQLLDTVINQNGVVKARGLIERNGEIVLDGGDNGVVKVSGTLSTDGQNTGGTINVTGKAVQLNNGAAVTASGEAGGGVINIGNTQTTRETHIAENASVNAIALNRGNAGSINVLANMNNGTVNVAGKLNATAPNTGNGGKIETSSAHINIADSAKISTQAKHGNSGTWFIDPVDFTIAATGGDITGTALSVALTNGNVKIQTGTASATCTGSTCGAGNSAGNGDIFVNDVIAWAANNLTLSAYRNINIDSILNGSGSAKLALEVGQGALAAGNTSDYVVRAAVNLPAGNNFSTRLGSDGAVTNYTVITDLGVVNDTSTTSLQGIQNNLTGNYALGGNIDATPAQNWASATGTGFEPIGTSNSMFTGQFHGLGHTISNLTIDSAKTSGGVSLFADIGAGGLLRDIGLINASVASPTTFYLWNQHTGILVGGNYGTISNVYATGSVSGMGSVGGLVGSNSGTISNAYATGSVSGGRGDHYGGLVGNNSGTISNAYATGSVTGNLIVGGLVGSNSGIISNAYATGNVSGNMEVGGLVGINNGTISNVNATGNISGGIDVGGLVGFNYSHGTISNAYTTGSVNGNDNIGGLVGENSGTINNAYTTGSVSGNNYIGGLAGENIGGTINNVYATGSVSGIRYASGLLGSNRDINTYHRGFGRYYKPSAINNAFWNTETTGKDINSGIGRNESGTLNNVSGKTTAEMMQLATFSNAGWDIANTGGSSAIWRIYEGQTAPLLRSFLTPLTITADNITKTYNGLSDSVLSNPRYSLANATTSGHLFNQANPYSIKNAGSYIPTGLYSDQQGYDISYVNSVLTINKANLLITANDANKVYDGLGYSGGNGVRYTGFLNGETNAVLFGNLNYGGNSQGAINVGSYWITPSGLSADNYQISYGDGQLIIEPALLIDRKQTEPIGYNLEDQRVPLQVATTFLGNQKTQSVKQDDSEVTILIEKGGIKLPAD